MTQSASRGPRWAWPAAGLVAGGSGLATSWFASNALHVRAWPVVAVAEWVIRHTPGHLVETAIKHLGHRDKPVLVGIIVALPAVLFVLLGAAGRRWWWVPVLGFVALAVVGGLAVADERAEGGHGQVAVMVGLLTWVGVYGLLTEPLRYDPPEGRRAVLRLGLVSVAAVAVGAFAPYVGRGRRAVEAARSKLRLTGVTAPVVPAGADLGLALPWATPTSAFYRIDTSVSPPALDPATWRVRIHGMVERELDLSLDDLLARQRTQAWITLNCVSNPVGGDLIGNAWWSGVLLRSLLAEAGVKSGADAVLQTSADGWTCGTPLSALQDGRNAMLAVAMNGAPLPIDHGFPVRTVVPGLYGYVSACKWVVDLKVTTMDEAVGYWIPLGWSAKGPVKLASRIDRPASGDVVPAGTSTIAGVAWQQETGIDAVEVSVDGGAWQRATLGRVPDDETWVQWRIDVPLASGSHEAQVRAVSSTGEVQTAVRRDVVPDGASGWHRVDFEVS
ncbi:molybdopterin-dependent oxidoreductase [Nocardioides sp. BP30]|uniref:molybdopterin-dependent oxidoreductase n=1 Tax=Nocardioides sp. BP30 TaxID=3036374 RepID=UPI0024686985|nr:molybdopterin-dependent oxidoreductase [Nocardioides sp. BP30]WGL53106.1 molybdopterin-dependent oxidoreductase [Nocardioides sp. BP30]